MCFFSFSLLRNLITRLHLKFVSKLQKNYKNIAFHGRPAANCTLIADRIRATQPIRLQHLHKYTSRILLKLDRNTKLALAVHIMMAWVKRIYILMIKVNKLFLFFSSWYFLKEIENMFVFLSSFRNTHESLGKLWKHLPVGLCSHNISCSPKLSIKQLDYELEISFAR